MKIRLRTLRHNRGLSLTQLALKTGISKSYLSQIESGYKIPTVNMLCKIAKSLEVNLDELVDCEDDEK